MATMSGGRGHVLHPNQPFKDGGLFLTLSMRLRYCAVGFFTTTIVTSLLTEQQRVLFVAAQLDGALCVVNNFGYVEWQLWTRLEPNSTTPSWWIAGSLTHAVAALERGYLIGLS
jgi:hypothetical protein